MTDMLGTLDDAPEVLAFGGRTRNEDLILACAQLGYLRPHWVTVDPTYGEGRFWAKWRPDVLYASDLNVVKSPAGRAIDARDLPYDTDTVDVVVLDPRYKLNGTSTGAGPAASDVDYGADEAKRWQDVHIEMFEMIDEAARILRPGGLLLLKCQDQVCSGRKRWQTREMAEYAEDRRGFRLKDMLHVEGGRKQPGKQTHARGNYSTMLVLALDGLGWRTDNGEWRVAP